MKKTSNLWIASSGRVLVQFICVWMGIFTVSFTAEAQTWDLNSLYQTVQPMRNSLDGRLPLTCWNLPEIYQDSRAVTEQGNGVLATKLTNLWDRGVVPVVWMNNAFTDAGLVALAQTIRDNNEPIHVRNTTNTVNGHDMFFPNDSQWFTWSNGESYPIVPLAGSGYAYYQYRSRLDVLKNGGITSIAGLWADYEGQPHPWNGTYDANADANYPARAYYAAMHVDPTVLNSKLDTFLPYTADLKYALMDQSARQALTDVYGSAAMFGNYGNYASSTATPYQDLNGTPYPTNALKAGTVAQPALYANTVRLPAYFAPDEQITQGKVDDIHWFLLMRSFSTSAANDAPGQLTVPYVSSFVNDINLTSNPELAPFVNWGMSDATYKEFLKHIWLRGADGMSTFNPYSTSGGYMTADNSLRQIANVSAVLDEMLNYRDFLDAGSPMTFAFDSAVNYNARTIWSGLSRDTDAIVQVTSIDGSTGPASFSAFGQNFNLPAKANTGVTYYITSAGDYHRVDPRPYTAQFQFENNYTDSSSSQLAATTGKYPSSVTDPTFSTNVPGLHIRSGVYGYLADDNNTHSVQVSRGANQYEGNWVSIPNTSNVFNQSSFTSELFFNLQTGNEDFASIMGKMTNASVVDWSVAWRNTHRLEVGLNLTGDNNTNKVWLRSAVDSRLALNNGWHHLALVYDGATDKITLFLDYQPLIWEQVGKNSGTGIPTLAGILPSDIYYRANDAIRLGYINRSINALFDEFRFSPEVLDPYQFLHVNPEPNTLALLAVSGAVMIRRRKPQ